jgi:hypothetical protein
MQLAALDDLGDVLGCSVTVEFEDGEFYPGTVVAVTGPPSRPQCGQCVFVHADGWGRKYQYTLKDVAEESNLCELDPRSDEDQDVDPVPYDLLSLAGFQVRGAVQRRELTPGSFAG